MESGSTADSHGKGILRRWKRNVEYNEMCVWERLGADRLALNTIHITLIRSIMDYRSIVYGSSAETHLDK